jgi:hypothetical protein
MWGEEKLENLLRSCHRASSEQIIECILGELSTFANSQPQRDDMTLVVMKVEGLRFLRRTSQGYRWGFRWPASLYRSVIDGTRMTRCPSLASGFGMADMGALWHLRH